MLGCISGHLIMFIGAWTYLHRGKYIVAIAACTYVRGHAHTNIWRFYQKNLGSCTHVQADNVQIEFLRISAAGNDPNSTK